jgi:hypothetical protein
VAAHAQDEATVKAVLALGGQPWSHTLSMSSSKISARTACPGLQGPDMVKPWRLLTVQATPWQETPGTKISPFSRSKRPDQLF